MALPKLQQVPKSKYHSFFLVCTPFHLRTPASPNAGYRLNRVRVNNITITVTYRVLYHATNIVRDERDSDATTS